MTTESKLVQKRGRVLGSLTKAATFIDNIGDQTETEEIESRLQKLESWWEEFYGIEDDLLLFPQQASKADEFEAKYFSTQAALKRELKKRRPADQSNNNDLNATLSNMYSQQKLYFESMHNKTMSQSNEIKLPKINIPPFNGEYTQWPSFKDMFEATVHNNDSISRVHKFQLLKGLLQGSAARLINHFLITDGNYVEAWDKLKQRYDKKRTIISTIIQTFLDQPAIQCASSKSLRNLTETSDELLRGLKALGPECQSRDPWILHLLLNKMDDVTKQQWALHSVSIDAPSVDDFIKFLHQRCDALESCNITTKPFKNSQRVSHVVTEKVECIFCNKPHPLHKCYKLQRCGLQTRKSFINKHRLCINCLRVGHSTTNCPSTNTCFKCKEKHHTILHDDNSGHHQPAINIAKVSEDVNSKSPSPNSIVHSGLQNYTNTKVTVSGKRQAILPTVIVSTKDMFGNIHNVRALLDSGSESTFITDELSKKLGLKRNHAYITVNGLASVSAGRTKGQVNLKLSSRYDATKFVVVDALVLSKLTNYLPSQATILQEYNEDQLNGICLADPRFYEPNSIDMILGIDVFYEIVHERRKLLQPNLHLIDSTFGWIVAGSSEQKQNYTTECCYLIQKNDGDIGQLLQRFWEVEEISADNIISQDKCDEHFSNTHQFVNGRYVVELPIKENFEHLGSSLKAATSRMFAMERKFKKDVQLREEYTKFMREYLKLGHMTRISERELISEKDKSYYLPHHAVFKQGITSKKLRVVFDGSCKSSSGLSLNDVLMTGPTIQDDLFSILTRFRSHKVAFVSDIEKMYRQVLVHPKHQHFQRIVWREHPNEQMQHFKLTTVTYGLTCSAYLAIRTLHQIIMDNSHVSTRVGAMIKHDFYVDDLLSGCDTIDAAVAVYREISALLEHAGFPLRQWSSNSQEFLDNVPTENLGRNSISFDDPDVYVKTLGIRWLTKEDAFTFSVPEMAYSKLTKRSLLSEGSKLFDPLGWISPVTINFKILLQSLWLIKLEWDDPLQDDVIRTWCSIRNELSCLEAVRIPRFLQTQPSTNNNQYHGFCDASEKAYSAVVYARSTSIDGNCYVHIIASKTKVAPLKQLSIPRLELCGAVLLTKLLCKISDIFQVPKGSLYAWTDSSIVLSWLSDVPRKWNCFVANRTSYIIDKLPIDRWHHIPSNLNPADCASRGILPSQLLHHTIWWSGPKFLKMPQTEWPIYKEVPIEATIIAERRKTVLITKIEKASLASTVEDVVEKFSSYRSILRVLANCIRFAEACRKRKSLYITCEQLKRAENILIKWAQHDFFGDDIQQLQKHASIKRGSKLTALHPFIDENGILRVGGRLQNSNISYSMKHPAILPKHHQLTDKIVTYLHVKNLHPNPSTLLFISRAKYWIMGGKDVIKRITNDCINCFKTRPKIAKQLMGNLPSPRVTLTRAFYKVGIDYAGPIAISTKKGRGSKRIKAYVCLFVCMATKAIHVEVVDELSTDEFIAALRRFTGRRGLPRAIYSDNATNFVGARRRFDEFFKFLASNIHNERISSFLSAQQIEWHTIPPSSPHFGGLWEAGVKSIKTHLRRVLGEAAPTLQELQTLLIQIEAIVNSRPLTPMNHDPADLQILTPGHFLIGASLLAVPEENNVNQRLKERWELIQNMSRGFWRRWHIEYLTTLQKRSKWQHQERNFIEGELVMIKEDNLSTLNWARGRIIKIHPGKDGCIRVVTLKTANGELKRPITKLCKLPMD